MFDIHTPSVKRSVQMNIGLSWLRLDRRCSAVESGQDGWSTFLCLVDVGGFSGIYQDLR